MSIFLEARRIRFCWVRGCFLPSSSVFLPSGCSVLNLSNTKLPKNSDAAAAHCGWSGPRVSLPCFAFAAGARLIWSHGGQRGLCGCAHSGKNLPSQPAGPLSASYDLLKSHGMYSVPLFLLSPFHDLVSRLIQSRLARSPAGRKDSPQRQLFSRDHGCSHVEHKRELGPCCPLYCHSLPQSGCLFSVLEFALLVLFSSAG